MSYEYSLESKTNMGCDTKEHNASVFVHHINAAEPKRCVSKGGAFQFWRCLSNPLSYSKTSCRCLALRLLSPGRLIHVMKEPRLFHADSTKNTKELLLRMEWGDRGSPSFVGLLMSCSLRDHNRRYFQVHYTDTEVH